METTKTTPHVLIALLQTQEQMLAACNSVEQVYELMGYLADKVTETYPIGCFAGCSACCIASNTPNLSLAEWRVLYAHLRGLPQAERRDIARRTAAFAGSRLGLLWDILETLSRPVDMARYQRLQELMPQLGNSDCLLLGRGGLCGVYEARPAKCRAHGNFILRYQDIVQMHSCEPEQAKFERLMAQQGSRRLVMPMWNLFEKRIRELNTAGDLMTMLTVWLLYNVDTATGDLVAEIVEKPDWARLADPARRELWTRELAALSPAPWSGSV